MSKHKIFAWPFHSVWVTGLAGLFHRWIEDRLDVFNGFLVLGRSDGWGWWYGKKEDLLVMGE